MNVPTPHLTQLNQPLLFEMIRSFSTLARTLNLSHAVTELKSTRQTVRRHIETLETAMGIQLFQVQDRRYQLTPEGEQALPAAQSILAQGRLWLQGQLSEIDGMMRLSYHDPNGWIFHQQQQPVNQIWTAKGGLLGRAVACWADGKAALESKAMAEVRPYVLVYRNTPAGWMCVEVGERSFYSKWWGWANARSSVGRPLDQFPGGPEFAQLMMVPFTEVEASNGMRLDQVVTRMPREPEGAPQPIAFQRLLLGSHLPDGSFALVVVVDRPDEINISGLDQSWLQQMPEDVFVEFLHS